MALIIDGTTVQLISGPSRQSNLEITLPQGTVVIEKTGNVVNVADNESSAVEADFAGILVNTGSAGQRVDFAESGAVIQFTSTPALIVGQTYVVGSGGLIDAIDEQLANDFVTHIGICLATDQLTIRKFASGVQRA